MYLRNVAIVAHVDHGKTTLVDHMLKQAGTFLNPARLRALINVAKQNIAADTGLELLSFVEQASTLAGGNITFTTLPIVRFGTDPAGEDVNIVNLPEIQTLVHNMIGGPNPTPAAASPRRKGWRSASCRSHPPRRQQPEPAASSRLAPVAL